MPITDNVLKCPVCMMSIQSDDISIDYMGSHFAFCSQQCSDRFRDNPNLYVGYPGSKAPAQEGKEVLKQRVLKMEEAVTDEIAEEIIKHVSSMMGVKNVGIDGHKIIITYDLLQATEDQIEREISQSGGVLGQGLAARLRRAFIHYMEETEVLTMEARPGSMRGHNHLGSE